MDGSEVSLRDCDCGHWTGCNAKVTDEALIGELVKRGVLRMEERQNQTCRLHGSTHRDCNYEWFVRYASDWREPVGSGADPALPSADDVFGILRDGSVGETD